MPILLGLDTGGTYTDAVLFDPQQGVLASAKALTTKHNLSIGLKGAIEKVLPHLPEGTRPADIALVSMSTTLATNAIAGSFVSDDIEDYYTNPYELGYGHMVKFDHDLHGREALEALDPEQQRKKVTFAWNREDLGDILANTGDGDGDGYMQFDMPIANYGSSSFDQVTDADGTIVGASMFAGYSANEHSALSLGVVVPVTAGYYFVQGEDSSANEVDTQYQGVEAALLVNLRLKIKVK